MKRTKEIKGITLIALVITIIVLLILAGITIATLTGENGILTKATKAKEQQSHAQVKEAISLAYTEYQMMLSTGSKEEMKPLAKVASREVTKIAQTTSQNKIPGTFMEFLQEKKYIDENGVVKTEELLGSKAALGNGNGDKDVYKIEEQENKWVLNYYDTKGEAEELWSTEMKTKNYSIYVMENFGGAIFLIDNNKGEISFTQEEGFSFLPEKFEKAYIPKKDGTLIDISSFIFQPDEEGWSGIVLVNDSGKTLTEFCKENKGMYVENNTIKYTVIIEKDGIQYSKDINKVDEEVKYQAAKYLGEGLGLIRAECFVEGAEDYSNKEDFVSVDEAYLMDSGIKVDVSTNVFSGGIRYVPFWAISRAYTFTEENQEVVVAVYLVKDGITYKINAKINNYPT